MGEKSWHDTGFGGLDDAEKKAKNRGSNRRFFIKEGGEARIMFLEDSPFCVYEHHVEIAGKWGNFFTCSNGIAQCFCCDVKKDNPQYVGFVSILDRGGFYSEKDKKQVIDIRRIFPGKAQALRILERLGKKHGGLRGCVVDVFRSTPKAANCGDQFEFIEKIDPASLGLPVERIQPYNWMDVLKPRSFEETKRIIEGGAAPATVEEDTIPFD